MRLPRLAPMTALRISAVLTLVALALMVWSLFKPTPMPVIIAMSVGQLLGTSAFALYIYVVFRDITRARRARRASIQPPIIVAAAEAKPADKPETEEPPA